MDNSLLAIFGGSNLLLRFFAIVKVIFIILDIIVVAAFLYATEKAWHFRPKLRPAYTPVKKTMKEQDTSLKDRWQAIARKIVSDTSEARKTAIIEADAVADEVLKRLGLEGEHMADRMESLAPDELRTLDRIWRAHRIKNDLVNTPGFDVSVEVARRTIEDYEAFLKEVEAL